MAKKVDKSGKFKFYNRTKSRLKKLMIRLTPIKIRKLLSLNEYLTFLKKIIRERIKNNEITSANKNSDFL